jgi:hypothetical protein
MLDRLRRQGQFSPPRLTSLEEVLEEGLRLDRGRVFADLWDAEQFAECSRCSAQRVERLRRMNFRQQIEPPVACNCRT